MSHKKRLNELEGSELVFIETTSIETWPFRPLGTLKKPSKKDSPTDSYLTEQDRELVLVDEFIKSFSQYRYIFISWIIVALIGVLGNLGVNFLFSGNIVGNSWLAFSIFIVILCLVTLGLLYIPKMKVTFRFVSEYHGFPKGFEQYIDAGSVSKVGSRIKLNFNMLDEVATSYAQVVKANIFKDDLKSALSKCKYLRLEKAIIISPYLPAFFLTISTNQKALWCNISEETIRLEYIDTINALFRSRMRCGVMAFKLDPELWRAGGAYFLDAVVDWEFSKILQDITNEINKAGH
jgi:hypothetical protein